MEYYEVVKRHQDYKSQTLGFWEEIIDIMEYNGKTILVLATIWDEYYQDYYSGNVILLYNGKTEYKIGQEIGIAGKMEGL
ncbi:hypothetical protein JOD03_000970 [Chryseomicrobium aureum]|uniref:hypothetical protein n=1 Tax=Chryseomicrobium aureum TaxID=1441723 RepID=UPI00195970F6|nr:hypothetical protein [Chryseomicrobium aureum]MBM7706068.1 hypothetical protein [Chryseomicrobium aureum]